MSIKIYYCFSFFLPFTTETVCINLSSTVFDVSKTNAKFFNKLYIKHSFRLSHQNYACSYQKILCRCKFSELVYFLFAVFFILLAINKKRDYNSKNNHSMHPQNLLLRSLFQTQRGLNCPHALWQSLFRLHSSAEACGVSINRTSR